MYTIQASILSVQGVRQAPPVRRAWLVSTFLAVVSITLGACGGGDGGGNGGGNGGGGPPPPPPPDTTAPTVPTGVTATAQSASQVLVSWTASTDAGSGVAGYHVFRDGATASIATITGATTYTDSGLAGSTLYSYTVTAFDSASPANESAASAAATATTATSTGQLKITVERAFANLPVFRSPVLALQPPGDGSTWYVVEQEGRVVAFDDDPAASTKRVFIDLSPKVESFGEAGLLGMAFHPNYPTTPRVYLSYTAQVGGKLVSRISSFETRDAGASLDPASETILLTVDQPAPNHNGGNIAFGPADGFLYIGFGDGGGKNDAWGTIGNGQNLTTLLGKMLRIDVDGTTSAAVPYRIPQDNPYASNAPCSTGTGAQDCPEIFAYGFRNPWRWSFDRTDHTLWVGDVGEATREEVNRVTLGGNYGWRCKEGTLTHSTDCGPNANSSLPPIAEYSHDLGLAVTGGYVYRGTALAALKKRYVFGDYASGRVWHIANDREPTRTMEAATASETGLAIASFAEDADGELFIVDYKGTLQRLKLAN